MSKKTTIITVTLAFLVLIFWMIVRAKHQNDFDKNPPVIQAVSEIEKNLKESDQKAQK